MAFVRISYTWPEGGELAVVVQCKTSFPDALNQAKVEAVSTWREAWSAVEPEIEPAEPEKG